MKECKYCGTQYADHLQSCPSCGANVVVSEKDKIIEDAQKEKEIANVKEQIEAQNKAEKPRMAPGKKMLIAVCSVIAVLAVVIIATTILNNRPVTTDGKTNSDLAKEYKAALESMELGNYEAAIAELDSIPVEYKDYDKVAEQRERAIEAYREQVLTQVDSYVAVGKHNDALSALTVAMDKYGENKELVQKKDEILYGYKKGIFAEAENYATTGDYSTAIKRLQMLLDVVGTDADTEMKIRYYEKAQVLKQVQVYESENNYVAAIEYLQKKLEELGQDADLATKLTSMYSVYKASCIETAKAYITEKDYENAITVLEDLSKVIGNDDEVSMLTYDYKKALALEKAQTYIDNEDYLPGIEYVKTQIQMLGEDSALSAKLGELVSLQRTVVMQAAEKDAKNGQYTNAVTSLKSLISTIGSDAEIESKILEYRKKEINVKLAEYDKSKDYAGAITYLQGASETKIDEELKSKLEDYISKYKKDLFAKAEIAYEANGYSAAVQLLNNDKLLKNDSELKEKIAYYNNKKPVLLSGLEMYEGKIRYKNESVTDVAGNTYAEFFSTLTYNFGSPDDTVIYYLNNQYEFFECKFVLLDANNEYGEKRTLIIKNDDTNEVLFSKKIGSKDVNGIEIRIDVSDVTFLRIEMDECYQRKAVMVNAQLIKK